MHRHGYKGKVFGRKSGQRKALIASLAESLIRDESIETTLPKAKELQIYMDKLVTKAKDSNLQSRRLIISELQTKESSHKLIDEIVPKLKTRKSGYLKVERTRIRKGDNSQLARISFIDDPIVAKKTEEKKSTPKKSASKNTAKVKK